MNYIHASRALVNQQWRDNVKIGVAEGRIVSIEDTPETDDPACLPGLLIPGYFDTQVNGGGGVLLNQSPTPEGIKRIARAHLAYGTTSMLPTLITDDVMVMGKVADAVAELTQDSFPGIRGVHFEGPHLSTAKKGVHLAQHIRPISDQELSIITRQDIGRVLMTIAPETLPVDVIKDLSQQGVILSLGHSNADSDTVLAALEAGATGFTHVFNAMSPLSSREPGMVGQALLSDAFCGMIVDHKHLHRDTAKLVLKVKTHKQILLVTDAMAHVGTEHDTLPFFDTQITRTQQALTTPDGRLAGSCLDMHSAVLNTHRDLGANLIDAVAMASATPAEFMEVADSLGTIDIGQSADFLLLDEQLGISQIWQQGCKVQ